jgi:hypothetical protein
MAFFDKSKPVETAAVQSALQAGGLPPGNSAGLRDLRAQAVHRLQIGAVGLAAMLLLVGLANIIMDRAQLSEDAAKGTPASAAAAAAAASPSASETAAKDPLVDMGVAPELPVAEKSSPAVPAAQ